MDTIEFWKFAGVIFSIVTTIVGGAVGIAVTYLKLFIKTQLAEHKEAMLTHIDARFMPSAQIAVELAAIYRRLQTLENRPGRQ